MTGSRIGNNPWVSLAAEIINRARADCKGNLGSDVNDNLTGALLQYDAEQWLRHDPWCQYLLDCALPSDYDIHQSVLATKECQRRKKSYRKYLQDLNPHEQFPIHALAKILGLSVTRLNNAAYDGCLEVTQRFNGATPIWCTSTAAIAKAVAMGSLVIHK